MPVNGTFSLFASLTKQVVIEFVRFEKLCSVSSSPSAKIVAFAKSHVKPLSVDTKTANLSSGAAAGRFVLPNLVKATSKERR